MAFSEVLLLKHIVNLGAEGDQVKVRAGYARNYLLPQRFAVPVTQANKKQIEALKKARVDREANELEIAQGLARRLIALSIAIPVKTGEGGKMFGAVTAADLLKRLAEDGIVLDKKRVSLYSPIKTLGRHSTRIKIHPEVTVDFEFEIVSENPIKEVESAEQPSS